MNFDNLNAIYQKQQHASKEKKVDDLLEEFRMEFDDLVFESKAKMRRILPGYDMGDLAPHIGAQTMDLHFNTLYRGYVKKFNDTGDSFQEAGAFLHQKYFENLTSPHQGKIENIQAKEFIIDNFKSVGKFKTEFSEQATTIQGNGWAALTENGAIIQIPNHKKVDGIVLILDMWEHAYYLDHGPSKELYVREFWNVVDWDIVGARL